MTDVVLNPTATGNSLERVYFDAVSAGLIVSLNLGGATSASATFSDSASGVEALSADMDSLHLKTNVANAFSLSGVRFSRAGQDYVVKADGSVQINPSPVTGNGTTVGTMTPAQGEVVLNSWEPGSATAISNWRGVAAAPINGSDTPYSTYAIVFRVPTAPLKPGSFSLLGTMQDGTTFNVTADANGYINATRVKGKVNYTTGVGVVVGVSPSAAGGQTLTDLAFLGVPSIVSGYVDLIQAETMRFNAVAYSYLPLDPVLLGLDPTRLPSDGRVPIFRPADFVVVGEDFTTSPATAVVGGTVNTGHTRLSRVRVVGHDGATIISGYSVDREAGVVTWDDVTGYSQPVRVESRIEDMAQLKQADLDGSLTLLKALTHEFSPNAKVSSALMAGDLKARVPIMFDQATWSPQIFSDTLVGAEATSTYNNIGYPVQVTNAGAITERWALVFRTNQSVDVIGEHVGNLGNFSINADIAPINALTGEEYFRVLSAGWGNGWIPGNLERMNTVAAINKFCVVRTIKQGPEAGLDYSFTLLGRGDVDNPLP